MNWEIVQNDVLDWARDYTGPRFHSMFTDCPYEYGFMNKSWDSSGVSFNPETWAALGDHLYPGAFCLTYAGARTWHRIAVAIEDAGFIIHPSIFGWLYSSGFPKATRIDDQVDKALGKYEDRKPAGLHDNPASEIFRGGKMSRKVQLTEPATEEAKAWEGHRYGLQALKPALEPILLFQKPYDARSIDSIRQYVSGSLWIAGASADLPRPDGKVTFKFSESTGGVRKSPRAAGHPVSTHRHGTWTSTDFYWPANFVMSHHVDCVTTGENTFCVEGCPVSTLGDNSRFFLAADWEYEMLEADRIEYCSKPSIPEKEAGLHSFPVLPLEEISGGGGYSEKYQTAYGARKTDRKNPHPTIKPISLNKWAATLLLPPDYYEYERRLLIPFSGVASEGIGAMLAGWDSITMVELDGQNCELGQHRMAWWQANMEEYGLTDPKKIVKNTVKEEEMQARLPW